MKQTITGLGMMLAGSAIILFKEPIVSFYNWVHRSTLGIQFPENWTRSGTIFLGTLMAFYGLMLLLRILNLQ